MPSLFPLYHYSFKCFFSLHGAFPFAITRSPFPLLFPFCCYYFLSIEPFSLVLLLFPLLPLFSPLCHCSLYMPLISLSPWLFHLCHHFLPFVVTPSPWALSLPCAIAPSPWTFSFSYAATFSPLPLFSFSLHGSFPFTIAISLPLFSFFPLLFPLCHRTLTSTSFSPFCHCSL